MGAWGSGPFDNDDAADFSEDFDDASAADRPELIRAALQDVVGVVDYLDVDAANVAIVDGLHDGDRVVVEGAGLLSQVR